MAGLVRVVGSRKRHDLADARPASGIATSRRGSRCPAAGQGPGCGPGAVERESKLEQIQSGRPYEGYERDADSLVAAGAAPADVAAALVRGFLTRDEAAKAKLFLDGWTADSPREAQPSTCWDSTGGGSATAARQKASSGVLCRSSLATSRLARGSANSEQQGRLEEAYGQYVEMVKLSETNEIARIGLARLLREKGRIEEARSSLDRLSRASEVSPDVARERGQIELDAGNYDAADRWFRVFTSTRNDLDALRAAATGLVATG